MSKQTFLNLESKLRYVRRMIHHRWEGQTRVCPYCGPVSQLKLIRRKKMIVEILQCQTCHLWFRWPTDTVGEHDSYYQEEFARGAPQIMLPGNAELDLFKRNNFSGTPLNISDKIQVLKCVHPGGRILDFGCSWGYGTYQLRAQGFDAVGFEVSKPRSQFGRNKLGLTIMDSVNELAVLPDGSFDIIFSNHVVEHLPDIGGTFALLTRVLKENGIVFHILPNFMGRLARAGHWVKWIGEDHPVAPAMPFFDYAIPRAGLTKPIFGSDPFDNQMSQALSGNPTEPLSTEGIELLVYARKKTNQ